MMSVVKADQYVAVTNNNSQDICNKNGTVAEIKDNKMGNQTEHNEYNDQVIETESNCSMEDTVAKLEHALRKNFKAQSGEDDGEDHVNDEVEEGIYPEFSCNRDLCLNNILYRMRARNCSNKYVTLDSNGRRLKWPMGF